MEVLQKSYIIIWSINKISWELKHFCFPPEKYLYIYIPNYSRTFALCIIKHIFYICRPFSKLHSRFCFYLSMDTCRIRIKSSSNRIGNIRTNEARTTWRCCYWNEIYTILLLWIFIIHNISIRPTEGMKEHKYKFNVLASPSTTVSIHPSRILLCLLNFQLWSPSLGIRPKPINIWADHKRKRSSQVIENMVNISKVCVGRLGKSSRRVIRESS